MLGGLLGGGAAVGLGPSAADSATRRRRRRNRAPQTREYWLQIDSVPRDAAPNKFDPMMGSPITIRTAWQALIFRAYTPNWGQLLPASRSLGRNHGFPGPILRAQPGDTLIIHLRNNDTYYQEPHSIHLHGVRYQPPSDGAWTSTFTQPGTAIPVGDSYTYTYDVLETSIGTWPYHDHSVPFSTGAGGGGTSSPHMSMGPTANQGSSGQGINHPYPVMEIGAELGLMGHVIIADPDETPPDREFVLALHELYASDVAGLDGDVDLFNGNSFLGNTPTFKAKVGDTVRWHIIALGVEFHVFHVHGHRWQSGGRNIDSEILGPSTSLQVDYVEDNPGRWLYHCHVVEHMMGGMVGWYLVDS
jgi:FtsP/CotA-like multicopper oxidase with cupredoxin domain